MTDETDREDDIALAAEYALGLMTPAEEEAFEARLSVDPEFRALYAAWAEDLVTLTDAIPEVTPPGTVKAGIEAQLFPAERRSLLKRFGLPGFLALAVAAVALVAVLTPGFLGTPPEQDVQVLRAEIVAESEGLRVLAAYDPDAGALLVERPEGAPREGRALELWLIADGAAPVSLGVLPATRSTAIALPQDLAPVLDGAVLAISDEPPGGSPTGAPTGEVLATAQMTLI